MESLVYVAFGDSITDGYGVDRGFVSYLAQNLNEEMPDCSWEVMIRGMSGETSQDGLYRLDRDVIAHDPALVTIILGNLSVALRRKSPCDDQPAEGSWLLEDRSSVLRSDPGTLGRTSGASLLGGHA